jgi:hypothetical protein
VSVYVAGRGATNMKQSDLFRVIQWIDASLEMLQAYEGRLKGAEVRIRSLLTVVRQELSRDLIENTEPDSPIGDADETSSESVWREH